MWSSDKPAVHNASGTVPVEPQDGLGATSVVGSFVSNDRICSVGGLSAGSVGGGSVTGGVEADITLIV